MLAGLKTLSQYTLASLGAYFIAWTLSYVIITFNVVHRLDFANYFDWLVLAWTFRGFEMVGFTWLLSLIVFLPFAVVTILLVKRLTRRQGRVPT